MKWEFFKKNHAKKIIFFDMTKSEERKFSSFVKY